MGLGYGRVSTRDRTPDAQRDRLAAAGCGRVCPDTISGTLSSHPAFDKVLDALGAGDVPVFTKPDRLTEPEHTAETDAAALAAERARLAQMVVAQSSDAIDGQGYFR
ncbi:recombinase family protein [Streptosporangium canum]